MLPSHWPKWILIPLALGLTVLTIGIGLMLEPAVQAITPQIEPTPAPTSLPPRLPYAAPLSDGCVDCHTDEAALQESGAEGEELQRAFIEPDDVVSLHGRLGCVTCHGGDGQTEDKDTAHYGMIDNPSHYQEAGKICLSCHHSMRTDVPEHYIHTPHERILWGIREEVEVCSCSNCHGPVAHGEHPVGTHEGLTASRDYCIHCHEEKNVPPERMECAGCHIGPHDEAAQTDCDDCHASIELWSKIELAIHPQMELHGRHEELHCFECHIEPHFGEVDDYTCRDCHALPHETFGTEENCDQCHTDGGDWADIEEGAFDHTEIWEYHVGVHDTVACQGCHFEGYEDTSADCGSCHALDPNTCNEEQTCTDCHVSDVSWSDTK